MVVEAGEVELCYWSIGWDGDRLECGSRPKPRSSVDGRHYYYVRTLECTIVVLTIIVL